MQALYNEYWGGFLQPLVCLMNMERIFGDPMGGGKIIDHHTFLMLCYRALRRHRCVMFIAKLLIIDIEYEGLGNDQLAKDCLIAIELMYLDFCIDLKSSPNE